MAKNLVRELIGAGVHLGHSVSRWNPKMAGFIFAKRGNIHIIDVKKTLTGLLIAKKLLTDVVSSGKDAVFVGTKRQAQKAVETAAEKCAMHYVSQRWLGGTLTNFRTIRSQLQRLEQLEAMQESGSLEKESKKHASRLKREMRKIKTNLDGIRKMSRLPGAVVVVDARKEYIALCEAAKLGIPTIGIIDTDSDPDTLDVAIPANDDSIRAIDLIINELADAAAAGKTMLSTSRQTLQSQLKPSAKRTRSSRPALARANEEQSKPTAVVETKPEKAAKTPSPVLRTDAATPAAVESEPERTTEPVPEKTEDPKLKTQD